jgi:HAE1 family hydrophobic/amphiphilic exporter-1
VQLNVQTLRPLRELEPVLKQLQEQVQGVAGVNDVGTTYRPGKPELRFQLDPAKAGDPSLNNDQLSSSVRALINGDTATTFRQTGQDTDVVVRLRPGDRAGLDDLRAISVPTRAGSVPLSALVKVEPSAGLTSIRRYDRLNQAVIGANLTAGRNQNDVEAEISARLAQIQLPSAVFVGFAGSTEDQQEGFTWLLIAMGLGVLFIYVIYCQLKQAACAWSGLPMTHDTLDTRYAAVDRRDGPDEARWHGTTARQTGTALARIACRRNRSHLPRVARC